MGCRDARASRPRSGRIGRRRAAANRRTPALADTRGTVGAESSLSHGYSGGATVDPPLGLPRHSCLATATEGKPAGEHPPTPHPSAATGSRRTASSVWLFWLLLTALALVWALRFGLRLPVRDEMGLVPYVTGAEPVSWSWLWSLYGDHRLPLPRLLYVAVVRATGRFEAVAVVSALAASAAAAALLVAARRARGRLLLSDLFLPLAFLQWGQHALARGFNLQFAASTALAAGWLAVALGAGRPLGAGSAAASGGCLAALVLCGGSGVVPAPPLALWLLDTARRSRRSGPRAPRAAWWTAGLLALGSLVLVALYFLAGRGEGAERLGAPLDAAATGRAVLQFLAIGTGPAAQAWWPAGGSLLLLSGLLVMGSLIAAARRHPERRPAALALLAFLLANLLVALAIGWSRGPLLPTAGLADRYVIVATPWLAGLYLSSLALASRRAARVLRWGLLALLALSLPANLIAARAERQLWSGHTEQISGLAADGLGPEALAERTWDLFRRQPWYLTSRLRELHAARLPPYAEGVPLSSVRVEPLAPLEREQRLAAAPQWRVAAQFPLGPAGPLTQGVVSRDGGRLVRIDVRLAAPPGAMRHAPPLRWRLARDGPAAADRVLAEGLALAPDLTSDGYAVLPVDGAAVPAGVPLALRLELAGDGTAGGLSVPLYAVQPGSPAVRETGGGDLAVNGFLFLFPAPETP